MKLLASLTILGLVMAQSVTAQTNYTKDPESCTSIMVGKKATTDGSVITSHTCDSWYRTWVNMVPAESYERNTLSLTPHVSVSPAGVVEAARL